MQGEIFVCPALCIGRLHDDDAGRFRDDEVILDGVVVSSSSNSFQTTFLVKARPAGLRRAGDANTRTACREGTRPSAT